MNAGASAGTRATYLRYARRFIDVLHGEGELDWSKLTAETVTEFVRTEVGRLKPCACRGPVTATRASSPTRPGSTTLASRPTQKAEKTSR